ncbi:MAG: DoxX family protein [Prolixibacteraceae bacterium]|jgi:putative oxidoreductase|nr:DoxX family protein [Prolixibacteraceae bacterium]
MKQIKQLLSVNNAPVSTDFALLLIRVGFGVLMLTHGIPKFGMLFSGEPVQFLPLFGLSATASMALAATAEVGGSLLLILGLGTRIAVIPLIFTMLVAVFVAHASDPLAVKEPAIHFLIAYFALLFAGSGRYSVDKLLKI